MARLDDLNAEIREIEATLARIEQRERTCDAVSLHREGAALTQARKDLHGRLAVLVERRARLAVGLTEDREAPAALPEPQQLTERQIKQITQHIVGPAVGRAIAGLRRELTLRDSRIERLDQLAELQAAEIERLQAGPRKKSMEATSEFQVKFLSEEKREISGIATSPRPDRVGDIVEPMGVKFKNPLPLLWQHNHAQPVGTCRFEPPSPSGIKFTAKLARIEDPGPLKDRVDEAWQSIRAGLVTSTSIGFRPLKTTPRKGGGYVFNEVEVFELSLCTIPANPDAVITQWRAVETAQ